MAGLKGIDLDKHREKKESVEKKLEAVQRRAAAKLAGGEKELERQEWADLGFGFDSA